MGYRRVHWSLEQDSITTNHEYFWCLLHKHVHNIYHASHKLFIHARPELNFFPKNVNILMSTMLFVETIFVT